MQLIQRCCEVKAEVITRADGSTEIAGYGALYYDPANPGTEYDLGGIIERIKPGAFDSAIAKRQNTEIKFNHSDDWVLSDVEHGAIVRTDDKGLHYSLQFDPSDVQHQAVKSKIEKGLIRGSSFAATMPKYKFERSGDADIAWLVSVEELKDCSPVMNPAYKAATAVMRSTALDEQYKDWLRRKAETEKRLAF